MDVVVGRCGCFFGYIFSTSGTEEFLAMSVVEVKFVRLEDILENW